MPNSTAGRTSRICGSKEGKEGEESRENSKELACEKRNSATGAAKKLITSAVGVPSCIRKSATESRWLAGRRLMAEESRRKKKRRWPWTKQERSRQGPIHIRCAYQTSHRRHPCDKMPRSRPLVAWPQDCCRNWHNLAAVCGVSLPSSDGAGRQN